MKFALCLLLLVAFAPTGRSAVANHPHPHNNITSGRQALKRVRSLYEVKDFFAGTPKSYKPILIIDTEPYPGFKYYWIKMGISNFDMLRTTENFYVAQQTGKIYVWDQLDTANSYIPLKQWRYWRSKAAFHKLHCYKAGKLVALAH